MEVVLEAIAGLGRARLGGGGLHRQMGELLEGAVERQGELSPRVFQDVLLAMIECQYQPSRRMREILKLSLRQPERQKKIDIMKFLTALDYFRLPLDFGPLHPVALNALIQCCSSPGAVLSLVQHYGAQFTPINSSTAVHRLVKIPRCPQSKTARSQLRLGTLRKQGDKIGQFLAVDPSNEFKSSGAYADLLDIVQGQLDEMDPQGLAMVWWSFSQLGHIPGQDFVVVFEQRCIDLAAETQIQGISNILWGYQVMHLSPSPKLVKMYMDQVKHSLQETSITSQHIANILYALAHIGCTPDGELLDMFEEEIEYVAESFLCCEIVQVMVAFKRLKYYPRQSTMLLLEGQVMRRMNHFKIRELSLILWSFADSVVLDYRISDRTLHGVDARLRELMGSCTAEDLARLFHAYAKLMHEPEAAQIEALRRALDARARDLEPNHICCIAWSLANLELTTFQSQMHKISETAALRVVEFDSGQIAWFMWSMASLNFSPKSKVMARILREVYQRMYYFSEVDLVGVMWACSKLNVTAYGDVGRRILLRSEECSEYHLDKMTPGKITSLLWSYATAGHVPNPKLLQDMLNAFRAMRSEFYPVQIESVSWATRRLRELQAEQLGEAGGEGAPPPSSSLPPREEPVPPTQVEDLAYVPERGPAAT